MGDDFEGLIQAARDAMSQAYCPYSNFNVGAALLTADDKVITGVNVENASYSAAICAERCALARAVAQGHRKFEAIAVCAAPAEPTPPCGICRQFLIEFGDMKVIMISSTSNKRVVTQLKQLLPSAFTNESLNNN